MDNLEVQRVFHGNLALTVKESPKQSIFTVRSDDLNANRGGKSENATLRMPQQPSSQQLKGAAHFVKYFSSFAHVWLGLHAF